MDNGYSEHLFSYRFDGQQWSIIIIAKSEAEAKERLKALAWAQYDGILIARIPSYPAMGLLVRSIVVVRNFLLGGK